METEPPAGEKILSGEVEEAATLFDKLPEDFRGRICILVDSLGKLYEAELLIQSSFIVAATITDRSIDQLMFGDFAMKEVQEKIRKGKGKIDIYRLTEEEFKDFLGKNDNALLELIVDLKNITGEDKREESPPSKPETSKTAPVDAGKEGVGENLETDWQIFNEEWKKYDEKQKPFLEALLKQKFKEEKESKKEDEKAEIVEPVVPPVEDVEKKLSEYESRPEEKIKDYLGRKTEEAEKTMPAPNKKYRAEEISDEMIMGEGLEETKKKATAPQPPPAQSAPAVPSAAAEKTRPAPPQPQQTPAPAAKPAKPPAAQTEDLVDKATKEIDNLKQKVDIFWGYDKKKKRFVGMDYQTAKENNCLPAGYEQQNAAGADKKPAPADGAAAAPRTVDVQVQSLSECIIPVLKKKPGLMDRMKLMKTPSVLKVLEKIDGKRTIEQIKKETKLSPEESGKAFDTLKKEGYIQ